MRSIKGVHRLWYLVEKVVDEFQISELLGLSLRRDAENTRPNGSGWLQVAGICLRSMLGERCV